MVSARDLSPPWIIFGDKGKPVAILPAGRPGEVANIRGLSMKQAQAIVDAANAGHTMEDKVERLENLAECIRLSIRVAALEVKCRRLGLRLAVSRLSAKLNNAACRAQHLVAIGERLSSARQRLLNDGAKKA